MLLTVLFVYVGIIFPNVATSGIPLASEVREAIDQYLTRKVTELGIGHDNVITLNNHATELEKKLTDRITKMEKSYSEQVQTLTERLTKVTTMRNKNVQTLNDRITEIENMRHDEVNYLKEHIKTLNEQVRAFTKEVEGGQLDDSMGKITRARVEEHERPEDASSYHKNARGVDRAGKTLANGIESDPSIPVINGGQPDLMPYNRNQRVAPPLVIAFYAIMPGHLVNPSVGSIIKFTNVKTNIGGHYHPTTGVFTCPQPGVYVFSWTIRTANQAARGVDTNIILNGQVLGQSAAAGVDGHWSESVSATVSVLLAEGDEVWIDIGSLLPGTNLFYCMFTGFLIHG